MDMLLYESSEKYVLDVKHQDIYNFYKKHKSLFWVPEEIDFQQDLVDWRRLNENEKYFIKHVLAFFAASDGIVSENLAENFLQDVQYPEARAFYAFQIAMENIHSETYSMLIETYVTERSEQKKLFEAIEHFPAIKHKADWALKWISKSYTETLASFLHKIPIAKPIVEWAGHKIVRAFARRLIAFVAVEGIFFSGSFCSIFWLKKSGLMPGLTFSNELISRDEGLHCDFAINLYNNHIVNKLPSSEVKEILLDALKVEKEFILESLPSKLIGMNSELMSQYLEFITDRLLSQLGCEKEFNVKNPFDFMDMISIEGTTNFFEKRVSEYKKASVLEKRTAMNDLIFDEDF
jgi:ribonucleoside-diphosphate reductase beta chain